MFVYPHFDPVAVGDRSRADSLVRAHVPARLPRRVVARAAPREASGLDLDGRARRRRDFLLRSRRDPRGAPGLDADLWHGKAVRRSAQRLQDLGRRHVFPRRACRRGDRAGALRAQPRQESRRRLRFHGAAAGDRVRRRAHRQLHQRRALGQADRRALGFRSSTASRVIRRSSTRRCSKASCCS